MKNARRNDQCSCMSGKKYKNCCLKRITMLNKLEKEGACYYNEDYFFKNLIKKDGLFNNFYIKERDNIKKELMCFKKNNLGSKMSYGHINDEMDNHIYYIIAESSPLDINFEIHAAHELQHLICCEEGFKAVVFKTGFGKGNNKLCKVISDMINDPIVNSRIMKYGFNLNEYYKMADEIQMGTIGIHPLADIPYEQLIFITTLYVKKTLDLRNIYRNISDEEVEFNKWISKNYSGVVKAAKQILSLIEQIGYDTPQKTEKIFAKTIDLLGLNEILTVINI